MPLNLKYFVPEQRYIILKTKGGGLVSTDREDLEMRVRDVLIKYLGKNVYDSDPRARQIIDTLSRNYRDVESWIRDSEFVMRSRAILKYYPHGDPYEEVKVIKTHNEATCFPIATLAYFIVTANCPTGCCGCGCHAGCNGSVGHAPYLMVGSDTSTLTYCLMPNLAQGYTQSPSATSYYWATGVLGSSPGSGGQVYAVVTSTWNAGVLPSGTIGEVGAFQFMINQLANSVDYGTGVPNQGYVMYARVSSASGAFSPISYTNTAPFTASITLYMAV
ncbi:hypothetical protein AFV1_ORF274 [Captovirus AFV1]|uniref:Uncharacterized protein ORF274 n=1 Tax=Acidianus filamentous virus 1 (isolate United States/Yellowstone) TaxID=654909 RepID=Y274_AFV1Y|nr:hypothetical protein AFV1_ORF274 [Captovirus AFV1]Q70LB9.1 RecName: Full=Uncharacterized protein ORF274 [Acidianus filamentous virus 1 (isolate Yellowstone)]CAD98961.1 hypothetical protein [Captovirus AFV1]